ncbi:MAG: glycosyltransferase, partial [Candidatus Zambryskibacteria bacterium]|nr:glycosyltransferase [Candidatus Zambryskibacteria bacterium]
EAKGAKVVEEAMKIVSKAIPSAKLITAGSSGKWLDREGMKRTFAESDLVLVPSLYLDAFPRIVLEAMAIGIPVVGTCFGGAPEAIVDGVTGCVVNPFNIKEMAEKIISLLENPPKCREFGLAARERIETNFNLDDRIDKLVKIYEGLS